jgi:ubiquinone/menaquinone biosynthesis C-methylase UbiE
MENLKDSVTVVGEPWKDSPYYSDAEPWTFVFWDAGTTFRTLFGRLDTTATLELACGHGRHGEKSASACGHLYLMDIHEANIEFCRSRLANFANVECLVSNGYDFQPLLEASLTAIYCYDAMVHFSPDLVKSYLLDTARVLKPGGRALYHHSNHLAPLDRHYGLNPHARNHMSKELFAQYASEASLQVVEQIVIPWGGMADLDCLTLVQRPS